MGGGGRRGLEAVCRQQALLWHEWGVMGSCGDETGPGPGSRPPQFLAALPLGGFSGPLENTSAPSSPLPGRPSWAFASVSSCSSDQ